MRKILVVVILAVFYGIAARSSVAAYERYELGKEEYSRLSPLLMEIGYTQAIDNVVADKYESGDILINVKLKPISKEHFKEITCVCVDYRVGGRMKISNRGRLISYDSTDFSFSAGPDVIDTVIDEAVKRYLSIIKRKELGSIKLGKILGLSQKEDVYVLMVEIPETEEYALAFTVDRKDKYFRKIEIVPRPMI